MSAWAGSSPQEKTRVGFVSVHYYPEYLKRSLRSALDLARTLGAESFIAVANREELLPELQQRIQEEGLPHAAVHLHDNVGLEFGAYQAGLSRLLVADLDWIVFLNDTFSIHSRFSGVNCKHLKAALGTAARHEGGRVAGLVDSVPRSFSIEGRRTHRWIRTSIFGLDRDALAVLGDRLYSPEIDELVRSSPNIEDFFTPRVDPALAAHLRSWLFAPGSPSAWYRAGRLSAENAVHFSRKARSVLQEKYLSATLEQHGVWFVDIKAAGVSQRARERLEAICRPLLGSP